MPAPHVVYWANFGENVSQLIISTDQGAADVVATLVRNTEVPADWWVYLTDDGRVPGQMIIRQQPPPWGEIQTLRVAQAIAEESPRVAERLAAAAALFAAAHQGGVGRR